MLSASNIAIIKCSGSKWSNDSTFRLCFSANEGICFHPATAASRDALFARGQIFGGCVIVSPYLFLVEDVDGEDDDEDEDEDEDEDDSINWNVEPKLIKIAEIETLSSHDEASPTAVNSSRFLKL
jgi:hypothetical protein